MPATVVAHATLTVGAETFVAGDSPAQPFACVFEDDGETGYFYALELERQDQRIVDAVHIYNSANVVDADRPSQLQIVWSSDGYTAALYINDYPHAVFDFQHHRGYCRTGFPPPSEWATNDHTWDDSALVPLDDEGGG